MTANTDLKAQLGGDYPTSWSDFIGQDMAKQMLISAAKSARIRGERMEPTLLASGTPGCGKTSLAQLTALELGGRIKVISGAVKAMDARIVMSEMDDGDVLFIDEIHLMYSSSKAAGGWLLHLLQDGVLMGPRGAEVQPKITVLSATTDAGRLPDTIRDRFTTVHLLSYTDAEAALVARALATRVLKYPCAAPSDDNCVAVARAASNGPRMMRKLWATTRDIVLTTEASNWIDYTGYDLTETLRWHGLTEDGLTKSCRDYMSALLHDFAGGAGERVLQDRLREPGGLGYTEFLLQEKGFIVLTSSGRQLTTAGIRRTREFEKDITA